MWLAPTERFITNVLSYHGHNTRGYSSGEFPIQAPGNQCLHRDHTEIASPSPSEHLQQLQLHLFPPPPSSTSTPLHHHPLSTSTPIPPTSTPSPWPLPFPRLNHSPLPLTRQVAISGSNQHREGETSIHAPTVPAQEALPARASPGQLGREG